jgi:hypothetical protein
MIDFENMQVGDVHDLPARWIPDARAEFNRALAYANETGGKVQFVIDNIPLAPEQITGPDKHRYTITRVQ